MMTREEVLEIDRYCQEHKMPYNRRLEELNIPFWNFYKAKRKYRLQDEAAANEGGAPGAFVQLSPDGPFISQAMPPARSSRTAKPKTADMPAESYLTVELRTSSGTAIRI